MTVTDKLSEFAETTSIHGIAHINSATKVLLKVFWSLVVLGGIVICVWYIYSSVVFFLQFPVLVQTEIKLDKLPFPAVTICNLNAVRRSKLHLVPKLKDLMSVCEVQGKSTNTTSADFCTNYRYKLSIANKKAQKGAK